MADVTITGLPNASALTGTERVPMDQAGTTVDAAASAIAGLATKVTVGLGNVDNTSDLNKPISTAVQSALDGKAASIHTQTASTISDSTAAGRALLTAADATAQRTALGLGTLATQSGTFSGTSSGTNTGDQTISLTGDVTGSGTGSFAATLANTTVTGGAYGSASQVGTFTVDGKGRLTAAANTAISVAATAISDSTTTGRAVLTAASQSAARTAIGAGTSSVAISSNPAAALGATASAGSDGQAADSGHVHQRDSDFIIVPVGDETTAVTTGANKVRFRMPYGATLLSVRASVNTAPTGSSLIVDINEAGTSVLGAKLSIDAGATTSIGSVLPATIADSALAGNAEIAIDIDQIGSTVAGAGLKVTLEVRRS